MQPIDKSIESLPIFSASKYVSSQFLSAHSFKIMSVHQSISIARQSQMERATGIDLIHLR